MDKAMKITKRQCQLAFFSAAVVVVCVCIGVTMNLTTVADENFDHMGLRTFCMFTVNSNILCAAAMAMVIPYTLDGLRTHNYHMPRWIVNLVYMGVTAVALTFLVSLLILSPVKGFVLIFTGSRFFLHGVCPILAIVAFCFFMSEKRLTFRDSLLALIPVLIYAIVYYVMVAGSPPASACCTTAPSTSARPTRPPSSPSSLPTSTYARPSRPWHAATARPRSWTSSSPAGSSPSCSNTTTATSRWRNAARSI